MCKSEFFIWIILWVFSILISTQSFGQDEGANDFLKRYELARAEIEKYELTHGNFIETRNVKMHYLSWGNPADLPLIWIHGSFTNSYEIKELAERISKQGYYLIAIDYYGHGLTPIPSHEVSLYHVADDVIDLMDQKGIEKAVIGGWSRGGYIASAVYDAYPERVHGLILEDGGSVGTNTFYHALEDEELFDFAGKLFEDRVEYGRFNSEFECFKEYVDVTDAGTQFELLAWITQDKDGFWTIGAGLEELFHISTIDQFVENIKNSSQVPLFARSMAQMEPLVIFRNLDVPILILDPVHDVDIFPFESENEKLKIQHSKLVTHRIFENTGHNVHFENPDGFLMEVLGFLKTIEISK
ncbi:alpha/beta hydrolase [Algoriphagus confluentis]|uniref:AB hydrolase-1 domain-containing protein n=1 Tax=Algoriphagus confluentis TaxID=1697556 RepID=A0ABQ6PJU9_9BACT|nr:hypothetical protein Aconfl_06660 [Algoriphagus confluentis]